MNIISKETVGYSSVTEAAEFLNVNGIDVSDAISNKSVINNSYTAIAKKLLYEPPIVPENRANELRY